MKKYLILLLVAGCSLVSFAQPKDFKTELYIGATGGMTFSKVRFYPNVIESFQQGNAGGIMFRLVSEPHIGFQVEVNYTQKGWKQDSIGTSGGSKIGYSKRLNYISMPVMTHVNLGNKAFRFTLNLGPEVAYMYSEEEKLSPVTTVISTDQGFPTYVGKPTDTQLDFLFTFGLGMEYHLKKGGAFALEGRAYYSLPNLFNPDNYPYKMSQSNGAQVKLAYLFQINKKRKK